MSPGRRLDHPADEVDPLYDNPTLPQVRSPVIGDPRQTLPAGGQIDLAHQAYHGDLLERIHKELVKVSAEAKRSADADVESVEVLRGCRALLLGGLAAGALLMLGGSALYAIWSVLT